MSKASKTETQARLAKEKAERDAKMTAQKAARLAAEAKKPTKPALPNRRPLSAIEADIIATQTNDAASLIKRGEYLIEAKESEQIEHGDWTRWLSNNFDLGERTAQSQMQVARHVAGLGKNAKIAVLNLSKSALYKMSHGDYHADCIPAILQEAGKRFLTPRDVDRVIYKYREEHKTPEEREAERLAAKEHHDLIAKADLQWMPDGDDGGLKVETPDYIYKIVGQGEDDGANKVWQPQRWWKDGTRYSPLAARNAVPLDVAKAVCAKDVIAEAAQKAEWAAQEAEWAAQKTERSETSEAASGADEHEEPASEPEADTEPVPEKVVTRDELMAVIAQIMVLPNPGFDGDIDVTLSGDADFELFDAIGAAVERLRNWRGEIGHHEIDGKSIWQLESDRREAAEQAEKDRIKAEKVEREAAAKAERKRERELEKLIRQQDKDLAKAERKAAKAAPPSDEEPRAVGNATESAADSAEKRRLENAAKFAEPDDSTDLTIPEFMRRTP